MFVIRIAGGLGNQMFQYAIARCIQEKTNKKLMLDISSYRNDNLRDYSLDIFELNSNVDVTKKYGMIFKMMNKGIIKYKSYYKEKEIMSFDTEALNENNKFIQGYFQNYNYFKEILDTLKKEFKIIKPINNKAEKILKDIRATNSVCVHIRRGDYISDQTNNSIYGTCDLKYYYNAINYIKQKQKNVKFFIFSDDIAWVKENLLINNSVYIDSKVTSKDYEDLQLMKNCNHFIIANSTFSWWAAMLGEGKNKIVVMPYKWFNNDNLNNKAREFSPKCWKRI